MKGDLYQLMALALQEAQKAYNSGEVPVGAVVADTKGRVIASAYNQPIRLCDPTGHAEILALREAGRKRGNYRLPGTLLVVTIEPCAMCMGAAVHARVGWVVFGAPDPKAGAAQSLYRIGSDGALNHRVEIVPGILEDECRSLIQDFFKKKR